MKRARLGFALATVAATGCFPGTEPTQRGIVIGGDGGTAPRVLVFTVQPSNATARNIITPPIQVEARDTLGVVDTAFSAIVAVAIGANPAGGRLAGTRSVTPVRGVALFGDLSIDLAGTGYTLSAAAQRATAATSTPFTIIAATP